MAEKTMFAIIGAAGNIGYATASKLRRDGARVRAILRDDLKASSLIHIGCEIAIANVQDADSLARAIGGAEVVQLILPPSPQSEDTANQMRSAIDSIVEAVEIARPKRILAVSDYGAHITHDIGMPTIFRAFEQRLSKLDCDKLFLRSPEHIQGWGRVLPVARASNILPSFHAPVDTPFPTISAPDVGCIAAELLLQPAKKQLEVVHVEGPRRYCANDVAEAVSELLGQHVDVTPVPRSQWKETFERTLNPSLTELLVKTNDAQNEGGLADVEDGGELRYGTTELIDALRPLV